jgi:hypothetical protein
MYLSNDDIYSDSILVLDLTLVEDLWWIKWHWDRLSPSISVSPANSHSTDCSKLINHPHHRRYTVSILTTSLNNEMETKKNTETKMNARGVH